MMPVLQRYLGAEEGVQAGASCSQGKTHRARQAVVVGERQGGQAQFHSARGQILRRRGGVEEREVAMAVEFGVG